MTSAGGTKNGVKMRTTAKLVIRYRDSAVNSKNSSGRSLSMVSISCVNRVIILAVGVSSSHLKARVSSTLG